MWRLSLSVVGVDVPDDPGKITAKAKISIRYPHSIVGTGASMQLVADDPFFKHNDTKGSFREGAVAQATEGERVQNGFDVFTVEHLYRLCRNSFHRKRSPSLRREARVNRAFGNRRTRSDNRNDLGSSRTSTPTDIDRDFMCRQHTNVRRILSMSVGATCGRTFDFAFRIPIPCRFCILNSQIPSICARFFLPCAKFLVFF